MAVFNAQQTLCDAIAKRKIVRIRYDDDLVARTYAPHIVYRTSKGNILVAGTQINNPAEPLERNEPRNFDLDKITSIDVTDEVFQPHPHFDPHDKRYRYGTVCVIRRP